MQKQKGHQATHRRVLQVTPSTLMGTIFLTGIVGTAALWLWAVQLPASDELSVIILILTIVFWSNIAHGMLKSLRLSVIFREANLHGYELDIAFILLVFLSLFVLLLVILILFVAIFPIGGNKLLLLVFMMMFVVLKLQEAVIAAAEYSVNHMEDK